MDRRRDRAGRSGAPGATLSTTKTHTEIARFHQKPCCGPPIMRIAAWLQPLSHKAFHRFVTETSYERLSAQDAFFLALEDPNCHQHVGAVLIFAAGPLRDAEGRMDIDRVRRAIESKLQFVPRFRQRLAYVPYENHPVWIDDQRFRVAYHVRHTALPRPGDERDLKRLVGRIMSQPLDRGRPLWEIWFVEGLEGDRFALISKTHHCMVDGVAGADLMSVILEPIGNPDPGTPEPWQPRPPPKGAELGFDALFRRLSQPA